MPRMSVNAAYFRRIYGNFTRHRQPARRSAATTTRYCVTAPADARLPDGGGERICGLLRSEPHQGRASWIASTTFASNFGNQYEHWNGVDLTMNARLPQLLLQGGVSTGRTYEDDCEVVQERAGSGPRRARRGQQRPLLPRRSPRS